MLLFFNDVFSETHLQREQMDIWESQTDVHRVIGHKLSINFHAFLRVVQKVCSLGRMLVINLQAFLVSVQISKLSLFDLDF